MLRDREPSIHRAPKLHCMTFTTSRKSKHCTRATTRAQSKQRKEVPRKRMLGCRGDWCSCQSSRAEGFVDVSSREGTVQLSDAVAFESILKLHHPLYEKLVHSNRTSDPSAESKIDKNSQIDTDTDAHARKSPRAPLRWNPEASRITSRTPPASPRSSSRTTASTGIVPGRHHLGALLRLRRRQPPAPSQPLAALGDCRLAQVPAERVHREGPRGDVLDGDVGVRGLGGVRRLREATGGMKKAILYVVVSKAF